MRGIYGQRIFPEWGIVESSNAKGGLGVFFSSDSEKPFDSTLIDGLDHMAKLLHADRLSTLRKSLSIRAPPKGGGDVVGGRTEVQ